jgi:hypothetical protein
MCSLDEFDNEELVREYNLANRDRDIAYDEWIAKCKWLSDLRDEIKKR